MCKTESRHDALPLTLTAIGLAAGGIWELVATYINNILLMIIGVEILAGIAVISAGLIAFRKVHQRWPFQHVQHGIARGSTGQHAAALTSRAPLALPPGQSSVQSAVQAAISSYEKEFQW